MTDTWNVSAVYDKSSYTQGETMTITFTGGDVLTTTTPEQGGTVTITWTAADGSTTTVAVPPTTINVTTSTQQAVKITSVSDTSNRVWTIAANGLSCTATA